MNIKTLAAVVISALFYVVECDSDDLRTCTKSDFHYEYTACDSEGGRWRVSVPSPNTCSGGNPDPPVRGQECDFTCDPGEYLDVNNDQECHRCPVGKYSLGGGVLYKNWDTIPVGFSTHTEPFSFVEGEDDFEASDHSCTEMGWQAKGHFVTTNNTECISVLTYSAKLVREGTVTFAYQFVDNAEASVFTFDVDNSECQASTDDMDSVYLDQTENNEWRTKTIKLPAGVSILNWKSYAVITKSSRAPTRAQKFITLQSIAISGVAFTSDCTPCEPGTYSPTEGAEICPECPANTYSGIGATMCTPCDEDTQFSEPGSAHCSSRPSCTSDHYVMFYEQCFGGNTRKLYKWIEPHICRGGVNLPSDGPIEPCPACNVGMQLINGTCRFCHSDEYSDGSSGCKACPGSTAAQLGVVYKRWDNLPDNANITTHCMSLRGPGSSMGCISADGWTMNKDYMQTIAINADDVFLVVTLDIGGFRSNQRTVDDKYGDGDALAGVNAELSFVFDTVCSDSGCEFMFFMQEHGKKTQLVQSWHGSQGRVAYRFPMTMSSGAKFTWAYRKSDTSSQFKLKNDYARLYLVNVTNTLDGGAENCRQCPQGTSQDGCIPCSMGEYIDPITVHCTPCPSGTVVSSRSAWGHDSCVHCGPGLYPYKGHRCVSNCTYQPDGSDDLYDFQRLAKILTVKGPKLFTATGDSYYHLLNISLCGNNGRYPLASCSNNMTNKNSKNTAASDAATSSTMINAHICQSTLLLSKVQTEKTESVISVSPISLGSRLVAVTNKANEVVQKLVSDAQLLPSFEPKKINTTEDIYMLYTSDTPTAACRQGRNVTMILRCVVNDADDTVILPKECSDGTCDGCNFIVLIHSSAACPICTEADFDSFVTTCVDGRQTAVLKMIRACNNVNSSFDLSERVDSCSEFWQNQWPMGLKVVVILVPVLVIGGTVLLLAVIYCGIKNRSLEYKYMKLIESSTSNDGNSSELSAVDTCALHEGEEEEEEFDAVRVRQGKKFFGKFKLSRGHTAAGTNLDDDELFESMRMSEKSLTS